MSTAAVSFPVETTEANHHATHIRPFQRSEMAAQARVEIDRFLALVETLSSDDWTKPTDCTAWNVRAVVAHQASHPIGAANTWEFIDQFNPLRFLGYIAKGMNLLDAANQRQVDIRAQRSTSELIAEIRQYAEPSIQNRQHFPFFIRKMTIPVPGQSFKVSGADLLDIIYTRDMWMHRYDIARAAGREFVRTAEHDGRIVELIVRELQRSLTRVLGDRSVKYHLTGEAGVVWQLGGTGTPEATITLDVMEFSRLASGRLTAARALADQIVLIEGDRVLAERALHSTSVLY